MTVCLGEIEEWASLSGEHDRVCVGETVVLRVLKEMEMLGIPGLRTSPSELFIGVQNSLETLVNYIAHRYVCVPRYVPPWSSH